MRLMPYMLLMEKHIKDTKMLWRISTSVFPKEMGRKIGQAEEIRHASDYDDFYIASKEESEKSLFS